MPMDTENAALLKRISEVSGQINRHKTVVDATRTRFVVYSSKTNADASSRSHKPSGHLHHKKTRTTCYVRNHHSLILNKSIPESSVREKRRKGIESYSLNNKLQRHAEATDLKSLEPRLRARRDAELQKPPVTKQISADNIKDPLLAGNASSPALQGDSIGKAHISTSFELEAPTRNGKLQGLDKTLTSGFDKQIIGNEIDKSSRSIPNNRHQPNMNYHSYSYHGGVKSLNKYARPGAGRPTNARMTHSRPPGHSTIINKPCKIFSRTGQCQRGPKCPYVHDPGKVAICSKFLQHGKCPAGTSCDLSHETSLSRVPACLHFLRGNCTAVACRYAHVPLDPSAPVCLDFASLGFCERGASCNGRHVNECPEYAQNGTCKRPRCTLPHIDRAGQMRKREDPQSNSPDIEEHGKKTIDPYRDESSLREESLIENSDGEDSDFDMDQGSSTSDGKPFSSALASQYDYVKLR